MSELVKDDEVLIDVKKEFYEKMSDYDKTPDEIEELWKKNSFDIMENMWGELAGCIGKVAERGSLF